MINFIEFWKDFRAFAYSDEIFIGIGAMLLIVSILKIVKSSAVMMFWVALSGLGLTGIYQGLDRNPMQLAASKPAAQAIDYLDTGKEISTDALGILCRKMEETQQLQLE